jgi:predicted ATPase/DNA-binding SARP family transcriptional activator
LGAVPVTQAAPAKVWALLAYLSVLADRPHRREMLAGLLWPDSPERAARASLRNALAHLRRVIGDHEAQPPFLDITRATVQFDRSSDYWLDVEAFLTLIESDLPPSTAVRRLEQAVSLYRGPFLEGFFLRDSAAFDDWCLLTRERFQRQVVAALSRLVEEFAQGGDQGRACDCARRLLELEPWQEETHRQLMRLLATSQQRSAALAQYEVCRRSLADELGVEPALETIALYERIRDGREIVPARTPAPHNLPASLTPFIGRAHEVTEIRDRLLDPACRLLTLVGPGGSGKTRLALEAARMLVLGGGGRFCHGIYVVPLVPLHSGDAIVPAIGRSVGLPFHAEDTPRQQLLDYLRQKELLLILDSFEHLLDGAGLVSQILSTAPRVKALITSRTRLRMAGEHLFPVGGLSYPDWAASSSQESRQPAPGGPRQVRIAARTDAIELFVVAARRLRPHFNLGDENVRGVVHICQLVDGMPLGILLAAAWTRVLTPDEIAARVSGSLDFLAAELRDLPQRQRSMRAVVDQSWGLLTERERGLMQDLSVFRGGFTHRAAKAVAGASLTDLVGLVDKSLIGLPIQGRYEVHELIRQYASDRLGTRTAAADAAREGHCAYFASALERWAEELKGPGQRTAMEAIERDVEDVRSAWDWAVRRGDVGRLAQAMEGLCLYYERQGRYQDGDAICSAAVEGLVGHLRTRSPSCTDHSAYVVGVKRVLSRLLAWESAYCLGLARPQAAYRLVCESLDILDGPELGEEDTRQDRAFVVCQAGKSVAGHDPIEARRLFEQGLALYEDVGDRWGTAETLERLGAIASGLAVAGEAKRLYRESLRIRRSLGDLAGIAESLAGLRNIAQGEGELEECERLAREALQIHRDTQNRLGIGKGLHHLACTLITQGRFDEASPMLEESVAIGRDLGTLILFCQANQALGWNETNRGRYPKAQVHFQESLAVAERMEDSGQVAWGLLGRAQLELVWENYAEALRLLEASVDLSRRGGDRAQEGLALAHLARAALGLDDLVRAHEGAHSALRAAVETGSWYSIVAAIPGTALLLARRGQVVRAIELYSLASRFPRVGNSRYWEDVAGRYIAAVGDTLPDGAIAAARERGRARDLHATVQELLRDLEIEIARGPRGAPAPPGQGQGARAGPG